MRRGARFYLRVKVPVDLCSILGRQQIWKALGTSERREAIRRYFPARAQLQATFEQARRLDLSADDARRMVTDWLHTLDRQTAQADFELCGPDLSEAMAELDQELFELRAGADVTTDAHRMLLANGWPARPHTIGRISTRRMVPISEPAGLDELMRRALIELTLRRRDRLHRRPAVGYDPMFGAQSVSSITLAGLIDRFTGDRASHLSHDHAIQYQALFRLLRELWGHGGVAIEVFLPLSAPARIQALAPAHLARGGRARAPARHSTHGPCHRQRLSQPAQHGGDEGMLPELAARLTGSSDVFEHLGRRPWASVNKITAHDGFTLQDLVSYNHKHNEANLEDNRDGTDANYSWNHGHEGPTDDPAITALRERQKCQTACNLDPRSASNFDPQGGCPGSA